MNSLALRLRPPLGGAADIDSVSTPFVHRQVTLYVGPLGDDTNPGTRRRPLRTIERALELALPGDMVEMLPGMYNQANNDDVEIIIH